MKANNKTEQNSTDNVSFRHACLTIVDGKAISITYSDYVFVAIGIQPAIRMRHIVILDRLSLLYFSNYLIKDMIFEQTKN
jgi:hypothetical protein